MSRTRVRNGTKRKTAPEQPEPRSRKGRETRASLLGAAREVFERDGFLDARITDISAAAGLSTGSFYTYFLDKEAIFKAVIEEAEDEMLHPGVHNAVEEDDPRTMIELSNRAYLESYRRNAKLMRLLEQVAAIDDDFREVQRRRARAFARRNVKSLRWLQKAGKVDPTLDAHHVSAALGAMVSRIAFLYFVLEFEAVDFEALVATVNQIWMRELQIDEAA